MKTLSLVRHFKPDEQANIPEEVRHYHGALLSKIFSLRANPINVKLRGHELLRLNGQSSYNPNAGMGNVDYITSSPTPRAMQTAGALLKFLPKARPLPTQYWADEHFTGDKYRSFHAKGNAKIDPEDFAEPAAFLQSLPEDADHVVLATHLPTIRALTIAALGQGDVAGLNHAEHRVRDNGDETYGRVIVLKAQDWRSFMEGHAELSDIYSSSGHFRDIALDLQWYKRRADPKAYPDLGDYYTRPEDKLDELALR